jgi:hypothetical protein
MLAYTATGVALPVNRLGVEVDLLFRAGKHGQTEQQG